MKTAVQLLPIGAHDLPRSDLVSGEPREIVRGARGCVALFDPGEVVAYRIRQRRHTRLFVFRTVEVGEPLATEVPGVRPRVRLLVAVRTAARARLAERLFAYLVRTGHLPSRLSDGFYLRVGAVLSGRLPPRKILASLLAAPVFIPARGES